MALNIGPRRVIGLSPGKGGGVNPLLGLFANGESGFLLNQFSDLSRLFTTAAGSTNVSANNDPVGRAVRIAGDRNATAANDSYRPQWIANSGKPYLKPDGADDRLDTGFLPDARGNGLTLAVAFRADVDVGVGVGGGTTIDNKRAFLALTSGGLATFGWGTTVTAATPGNLLSQNITMLMTGDSSGRRGWVNGVEVTLAAPTGAPDGTGGGLTLAAYNNGGLPVSYLNGRIYGAMAINRKLTDAEVAMTNANFGALL